MRIAARCDKQTGSLDFPVMFLPAGRAKMGVSVRYTAPCPPSEEGKSLYSLLRSAFFNMLKRGFEPTTCSVWLSMLRYWL